MRQLFIHRLWFRLVAVKKIEKEVFLSNICLMFSIAEVRTLVLKGAHNGLREIH